MPFAQLAKRVTVCTLVTATLVCFATAATARGDGKAAAPSPATRPASPATGASEASAGIVRAIRDLGDADPRVRNDASERLLRIGEPARSALQQAVKDGPPERAGRAEALLFTLDRRPPAVPVVDAEAARRAKDVDVHIMLRSSYLAASRVPDKAAFGGFGRGGDLPRKLDPTGGARDGEVYLLVQPTEPALFAGQYKGLILYVVNATAKQADFRACDSALYILQEAKDEKGTWRPVEYFPRSFCGNSYHTVFLDPGEGWRLVAPRYGGSFQTTLRFSLVGGDGGNGDKAKAIYSNEFTGSVNPEQFDPAKKQGHRATDIMDPYLD